MKEAPVSLGAMNDTQVPRDHWHDSSSASARHAVAGALLALTLGLLAWSPTAAQAAQGSAQTGLPGHVGGTGGYEAAFQANTGNLWAVHNGKGRDLGLGMKRGTAPAVAALP
jgi:hypothetical protein